MRWSTGTPTVEEIQKQQQRQPDPDDANATGSRKLWAFMEGIRGTAAYWSRAAKDLFAMYRSLGSATWFLTLSANDMHWDDLAIVLMNAKRAERGHGPMPRLDPALPWYLLMKYTTPKLVIPVYQNFMLLL